MRLFSRVLDAELRLLTVLTRIPPFSLVGQVVGAPATPETIAVVADP
jgi:hypothetical protein